MATPKTYRGFSTNNAERTRQWSRYDVELVKRDLLNHFETRIGERVMRPDFGCRIWDMMMDPRTADLRDEMVHEAERIIDADPRVRRIRVDVFEFPNGIKIEMLLDYHELSVTDTLVATFEREEMALSGNVEV